MKKRLIMMLAVNLIGSLFLVCQQQYPELTFVQIKVNIFYDDNTQMYHYLYTIANGGTNVGKIARFEVDISQGDNSLQIDTVGLQFENDGYTERVFRRTYSRLSGRVVPVGFLRTPRRLWSGAITHALMARFAGVADEDFILPGDTLGGFEMVSKALPGLRRCVVSPFFDVDTLFPDQTDTTDIVVPPVDSVRNAVKFHTLTIGPTAPPTIFVPLLFLDTLISYKHQAFALGWIKEEGIVTSLDQKLDNAKDLIQRGNANAARNVLQAFLNEVEALNKEGDQLTSEAYALLRFNTEYLLERLR